MTTWYAINQDYIIMLSYIISCSDHIHRFKYNHMCIENRSYCNINNSPYCLLNLE